MGGYVCLFPQCNAFNLYSPIYQKSYPMQVYELIALEEKRSITSQNCVSACVCVNERVMFQRSSMERVKTRGTFHCDRRSMRENGSYHSQHHSCRLNEVALFEVLLCPEVHTHTHTEELNWTRRKQTALDFTSQSQKSREKCTEVKRSRRVWKFSCISDFFFFFFFKEWVWKWGVQRLGMMWQLRDQCGLTFLFLTHGNLGWDDQENDDDDDSSHCADEDLHTGGPNCTRVGLTPLLLNNRML